MKSSDKALLVGQSGHVALAVLSAAVEAAASEQDIIRSVANRLATSVEGSGRVLVFGAGHAQAFAMELCSRAGGLREMVAMNLEDLHQQKRDSHWQLADSGPERLSANGPALLEHHHASPPDSVVIASQSGRNGATVEMAIECRRRGIYVAGVGSLAHSRAVSSRHPSGQRLADVVEDMVDNHCPVGDATWVLPGGARACASSTVSFALIAQMVNAELIAELSRRGRAVSVLVSANADKP